MTKNDTTPTRDSDEVGRAERDALAVPPDAVGPETQQQRWLKYGVNVALTSLVVLVLAGIAIWAAQGTQKATQKLRGRADLTSDGSNELKPQTVGLLRDLPADKEITLVSLYPQLKKEEAAAKGTDTYGKVRDILDEYRRNGKNIKVETIDPIADPSRLDAWLGEVKRKYSANTDKYETFVREFPKALAEIQKLTEAEAGEIQKVFQQLGPTEDKLTDEQVAMIRGSVLPARNTVLVFPQILANASDAAKTEMEQKIPDYKAAVQSVKAGLSLLSRQCDGLVKLFAKLKDEKDVPPAVKAYAEASVPRFEAIKARADESVKKTEALGELKLDDVRRKLLPAQEGEATPPAIAVMGPDDVRVIDDFALWKSGEATGLTGAGGDRPRLRFAGEQQLTSAILGLAQPTKQKVAFVRAGGPPKTTPAGFGAPAEFGEVAERLRSYNFDVVEKDFGPPNPRQQMPAANEPSDEDLKSAIWVVFASAPDRSMAMMGMPPPAGVLGDKLKAHLDAGGSALCLIDIQGDDLAAALKEWGIEAKPNVVLAHEKIEGGEAAAPNDFIEQARRQPPVFILNEFGDHPVTAPLRSLDAALPWLVQVRRAAAAAPAGVTVSEIVPIPQSPRAWGETDLSFVLGTPGSRRRPDDPTFDPAADVPAPLFAGAAAERAGKGRLVVIGNQRAFFNDLVGYPDPKLAAAKPPVIVARFPGNGELFTNSVFWLARNEKMIALSPSALDTARIEPVPAGKLGFIKVGVVLVALPLLAVAAGLGVWLTRRG